MIANPATDCPGTDRWHPFERARIAPGSVSRQTGAALGPVPADRISPLGGPRPPLPSSRIPLLNRSLPRWATSFAERWCPIATATTALECVRPRSSAFGSEPEPAMFDAGRLTASTNPIPATPLISVVDSLCAIGTKRMNRRSILAPDRSAPIAVRTANDNRYPDRRRRWAAD